MRPPVTIAAMHAAVAADRWALSRHARERMGRRRDPGGLPRRPARPERARARADRRRHAAARRVRLRPDRHAPGDHRLRARATPLAGRADPRSRTIALMVTRCYLCGGATERRLVTAENWWGEE